MISPNSEAVCAYVFTAEAISEDIKVIKDVVFGEKISEAHDQSKSPPERSLKMPDNAIIFHNLF